MTPTLDGELNDFENSQLARNIRLLPATMSEHTILNIRLRIEKAFAAGQIFGIRSLDKP